MKKNLPPRMTMALTEISLPPVDAVPQKNEYGVWVIVLLDCCFCHDYSAWQTIAILPKGINPFKQTWLGSIWDAEHFGLTMSVDLVAARKLDREQTVDETKRQQFRVNNRP
jgi:hypothetical protein